MASLTIIPYNPIQANNSHRPRAKDVFKPINDHGRELRIKPSILPVDTRQPQAIVLADGAGGLTTKDSDSISGDHLSENNDIQIEVDNIFAEADTESKVGSAEVQDSDAEFGTGLKDIEIICHPLKRKAKTGRQGSKDNLLVIPDSGIENESDSESEDGLLWKKRKVGYSLVGRQVPWLRMIDETDDEADDAKFEIGPTRVRAGDTQSENDGVAIEIGDGEGNEQSHLRPAASSAHHSDFVKPQSFARVGGNGEWGIHGITGKEVIEGKVYYCVDWEPTMVPLDELWGVERLVREFEAKEQARRRKRGNTQKRKHRGRHREHK
ncbi:hypothetical protein FGG08_006782 [Glutinoglossum americanum]|uniref:Uncharacterized protein n=1 Tax=Glutinoglossum americanum TaxID=1670608 RepID=A0A9P8I4K8_9PEZI|nr:hypothetical protein FGG08_006782 [Glutinoglossum americanum]